MKYETQKMFSIQQRHTVNNTINYEFVLHKKYELSSNKHYSVNKQPFGTVVFIFQNFVTMTTLFFKWITWKQQYIGNFQFFASLLRHLTWNFPSQFQAGVQHSLILAPSQKKYYGGLVPIPLPHWVWLLYFKNFILNFT